MSSAACRGVLLVGDAAGFLNPFTGQGIFLALTSGRAAAATILATIARRSRETEHFAMYDRHQKHERYVRSQLSGVLEMLAYTPPLTRRIIRRLQVNESAQSKLLALFCSLSPPSIVRGAALLLPMVV